MQKRVGCLRSIIDYNLSTKTTESNPKNSFLFLKYCRELSGSNGCKNI